MNVHRVIAIAALLVAASCRSGPDWQPPQPVAPEQWSAAAGNGGDAAPRERWWKVLAVPGLDALVETALADNRDLRAAFARIRQARAAAGLADATAWPQVDLAGGYARTRTTEATPSPVRGRNYDTWTLGFDVSWEIDLWGRLEREREARTAEVALATADARGIREALVAEVVATWAELAAAATRQQVAADGETAAATLLEIVRARATGGIGSELDQASAERLLLAAKARRPVHDREWQRARNRLAVLLGVAPASLTQTIDAAALPTVPDVVALGLPADLVRRRPDVDAAEQRLHAATARLGAALAARWPRLSIAGFFGLESNRQETVFDNGSRAMRAGPSMQLPLFTGGTVQEQIAVREAQIDEARAGLEQVVLRAFEEVETAASALQHERRHAAELTGAVAAAVRARQLAQSRFDAGLDDFLTVLDAEQNRLELADQLAQAQSEVVRQFTALHKALGGGIDGEAAAATPATGAVANATPR